MRINITAMLRLILLLILPGSFSFAQITLVKTDFSYQYTFGNQVYTFWDNTSTSVNIGSLNSSSWDFSDLKSDESYTSNVVDPNNTPFRPDYPHADWALVFDVTQTNQHDWEFYCHSSSIHLHGLVYSSPSMPGYVHKIAFHPVKIYAFMPMTYYTSWNDTVTVTDKVLQDSITTDSTSYTIITNALVDAYGPMTLPGGKTVDALRARIEEIKITATSREKSITYQWFSKSGETVVVKTDTSQASSGVISITDHIKWLTMSTIAGVKEKNVLPAKFELNQNYPNPFNPETSIKYLLAENSHVELKVFNIIGKEITTLVNENKPSGIYTATFNGEGLSSGIYFVRMSALGEKSNFNKTIKITLLK